MAINPLGLAGLTMTAAIIAFVLSLIIGALFVWFGAKITGVDKRRILFYVFFKAFHHCFMCLLYAPVSVYFRYVKSFSPESLHDL